MSHNILYCNDATASPKRLQTTKIQIPGEDRIASSGNDFDLDSFSDAQGIEKKRLNRQGLFTDPVGENIRNFYPEQKMRVMLTKANFCEAHRSLTVQLGAIY